MPKLLDVKVPIDARGYEVRSFDLPLERRAKAGGDGAIEGYAAVFNEYSEQLGGPYGFVEIIEPGFFDSVLADDVRALWQHDPNYVLGRVKNNTLTIAQDETGLTFRAQPPVTPPDAATWAQDALIAIRRGDVDQVSFTFEVKDGGDEWYMLGDKVVRRLKAGGCARLYDVSPVTFAAYPRTSVQARSIELAGMGEEIASPAGDESNGLALKRRRLELLRKI
jgi:HK97 family phage prohead protease